MELASTLFATGWASGVNAYASLALLGLLGRAGVGDVPDALESGPVIAAAGVMFAVEFVTDKVPYLDNAWDLVHTAVRPAIASAIGVAFGGEASGAELEEALAAAGSGATALTSHAVKAGLRLGINASPEPLSNILTSLLEDGLVAVVIVFAVQNPVLAAAMAALLLALGIGLVVVLARSVRRGLARLRERRHRDSRSPP